MQRQLAALAHFRSDRIVFLVGVTVQVVLPSIGMMLQVDPVSSWNGFIEMFTSVVAQFAVPSAMLTSGASASTSETYCKKSVSSSMLYTRPPQAVYRDIQIIEKVITVSTHVTLMAICWGAPPVWRVQSSAVLAFTVVRLRLCCGWWLVNNFTLSASKNLRVQVWFSRLGQMALKDSVPQQEGYTRSTLI